MKFPLLLAIALSACEKPKEPMAQSGVSDASFSAPVAIIPAQPGEVGAQVRAELQRVKGAKAEVVVYVGAKWCEPCRRFHQAVSAGELDREFPGLRLIEFDLDRDAEDLERAGYRSRLIPLFALPNQDGTASGKQMEGSIKGPGAVMEISPRLHALLR
jgi:thiol-disulfide isomerase/thioredoxin